MSKHRIKIGVRDNRLGRILGEQIAQLLKPHLGSATTVLVPIGHAAERGRGNSTRWPGLPLENALVQGEIDIAVQNMKDVPPEPPRASCWRP